MAYDSRKGKLGVLIRGMLQNLDLMAGWDKEEDIEIPADETNLEAGDLPCGEERANYACRGLINNTDTAGLVYYKIADDSTVRFIYLSAGGAFYPTRRIVELRGTGQSTTVTKVKTLWKDLKIENGTGEETAA